MKARKILAVSLTAAMTLALAACGGSSSDKESSSKDSSDKVYKIGICQQLEHAALDEATKGFEEACEEKFGKDKVKFDLQNGQGEQANCATIVNNFVADNDDLILASCNKHDPDSWNICYRLCNCTGYFRLDRINRYEHFRNL